MRLTHIPLLQKQLDLYRQPRSIARFRAYLDEMTQGSGDMVLPLAAMNPMGKEHCAEALERLIAFEADDVAARAAADAEKRLADVAGRLRTAIVLTDDLGGGWTDRHTTEAEHRFDDRGAVKRGWATLLVWTSEASDAGEIRMGMLESIYRTAYLRRHGTPRTLTDFMRQEGRAQAFAGRRPIWPSGADVQSIQATLQAHADEAAYPVIFACMYGDGPATKLGYDAVGLPERAGFLMGLKQVLDEGEEPVRALV